VWGGLFKTGIAEEDRKNIICPLVGARESRKLGCRCGLQVCCCRISRNSVGDAVAGSEARYVGRLEGERGRLVHPEKQASVSGLWGQRIARIVKTINLKSKLL